MKNKIEELSQYLNKYLHLMQMTGSSGSFNLNFPNFDLIPQNYLEFAEKDICETSIKSRINTVSNLKRALECELDTLLYILNLNDNKLYSSNVPKKLDFIDKLGLVSPSSFKKLNKIRNKIEHDYYVPEESEIDIFYDLIFSFISSIESFLLYFSSHLTMEFDLVDDTSISNSERSYFFVEYDFTLPSIIFKLYSKDKKEILIFTTENYNEFVFAFSTYLLLIKYNTLFDDVHTLKEFNKLHQIFIKKS